MTEPVQIAITGAAGQISYALIFRLVAGDLLGPDHPIALHLLEVPAAIDGLQGVVMELEDCASPLLHSVTISAEPLDAFADADLVFLIGARPRGPGMERRDLLESNAEIFSAQGRALNAVAKPTVRVLTIGNPANTNALIAAHNAPRLGPKHFSAMTRLDHNRATGLLAKQTGSSVSDIRHIAIWGNHSPTQYPDLHHTTIAGKPALSCVDWAWYEETFIPSVQQRGTRIIQIRGKSSAASAANAAVDHMRSWLLDTPDGDWVSMTVASDGSYGIDSGLMYSFPVTIRGGEYRIVPNLDINEFSREKMKASETELKDERDLVRHLLA